MCGLLSAYNRPTLRTGDPLSCFQMQSGHARVEVTGSVGRVTLLRPEGEPQAATSGCLTLLAATEHRGRSYLDTCALSWQRCVYVLRSLYTSACELATALL